MIRWLFDQSLRQKIPLWGASLIVFTTLLLSGLLMYQAYDDSKKAILASSNALGRVLSKTLAPSLIHDDLWRAFEMIRAPMTDSHSPDIAQPDIIAVISPQREVVVSSDPERLPTLSKLTSHRNELWPISNSKFPIKRDNPEIIEHGGSPFIYMTFPIDDRGLYLGALVIRYPRSYLYVKFWDIAIESALLGLIVLLILLPVNWYWGQRMAVPLMKLASSMESIETKLPEKLSTESYAFRDELGQMFASYNNMVEALEEKAQLERQVMSSNRLAAIGRLTAGIAHEINNPLLGMLTAIDTLQKLDSLDERSARAFGLIKRGLLQIRDTMGALLVEARSKKRWLEHRDLEDVQTLINLEAAAKRIRFEFQTDIPGRVAIPAGAVRQILLNLIHNAVRAAREADDGYVRAIIAKLNETLIIRVTNNGDTLDEDRLDDLFEPFVTSHEGGHGLGLWVTYQLVNQLGGSIDVNSDESQVEFIVRLPIPEDEDAI